ncbi:MAG: tyrosine--tRNA ligase [Planctomycetota bacterium]
MAMETAEASITDVLGELRWRGLLHQCTDEGGLREHLAAGPRRIYCGFDPTADSLTIGNLVPIMVLVHFARAGHEPIVVMGGGTGLIGDPSGKSAERQLQGKDRIAANVRAQTPIFEDVFRGAGQAAPPVLNNLDWLGKVGFLDALRDVGKHFSVNQMIQRDSVRERLQNREQGISFTEFSYMVLQALDFAQLHLTQRVTIQVGGSDQWGNIVAGTDLIRRLHVELPMQRPGWLQQAVDPDEAQQKLEERAAVFGLTAPLVTKADGTKFGKTEAGAVWLTPDRTSAYDYYQFWLNASDDDAGPFLRTFTLLSRADIEQIETEHAAEPGKRLAQTALARAATTLRYGDEQMRQAEQAAAALFSGAIDALPIEQLEHAVADAPSREMPLARLEGGVPLVELLIEAGLASSKREAREFLANGAIRINGQPVKLDPAKAALTKVHVLHGKLTVLKRGKKKQCVVRWVSS